MYSRKYRELQHNKNTRVVGCHVKNVKFWLNEKAFELASIWWVAVSENAKQLQQPMKGDRPASQCGLTHQYLQRDSTCDLPSEPCLLVPSRSGLAERARKEGRGVEGQRQNGRQGRESGDRKRER